MPKNQDAKRFGTISALMKFDGKTNIVAFNPNRPFDPKSLDDVLRRITAVTPAGSVADMALLAGQGVPHLVQSNLVFERFINNDAFILAIQRLFRVVRMALKSNLVYSESDFSLMTESSVMVYAKAKALQLFLKYYTFELGSAPHINKQLQQVSLNPNDTGLVNAETIDMLKDPIEDILLEYEKVRAKLQLILIPTKLKNFIDYFLETHFIDQSAVNAQIYQVVLRSCPAYGLDASGNLIYTGTWDVKSGTFPQIYAEADVILSRFAVAYADLDKTGLYSRPDLIEITQDNLKQLFKFRNDDRFFAYMINNYAKDSEYVVRDTLFKDPYIRIDVKHLTEDEIIMATMALSQFVGYDAPFKFISQAVYYAKPKNTGVPVNLQMHVASAGFATAIYEVNTDDQAVFQTNGYKVNETSMRHNTSATSITLAGALDNLLDATNAVAASSATLTPLKTMVLSQEYSYGSNGKKCQLLVLNTSNYGTQYAIWKRFKSAGAGTSCSFELVYGTISQFSTDQIATNPDTGAVIFTSTTTTPNGCTWSFATRDNTYTWNIEIPYTVSITLTGANIAAIAGNIYARVNNVYNGSEIIWNIAIGLTSVANSWDVSVINQDLMKRYLDDVEYHFPVVIRYANVALVNDTEWFSSHEDGMYKSDYIPIIIDTSNIKASLYWCFLGLFDMYRPDMRKTGNGKRYGKSNNKDKDKASQE